MRLKEQVCQVTGAGSGIGRAITQCFAKKGATVVAVDVDVDAVKTTQEKITIAGGICHSLSVDVSQEDEVKGAIATTVERFGQRNVLHNNAGISLLKPVTETTEADFDRLLGVNLKGVFFGCKLAIPYML